MEGVTPDIARSKLLSYCIKANIPDKSFKRLEDVKEWYEKATRECAKLLEIACKESSEGDKIQLHNALRLKHEMIKKLREICRQYGGEFVMQTPFDAYCKIGKYAIRISGDIIE